MTELPTGTITFLFTDIEESTQLLQELALISIGTHSIATGESCARFSYGTVATRWTRRGMLSSLPLSERTTPSVPPRRLNAPSRSIYGRRIESSGYAWVSIVARQHEPKRDTSVSASTAAHAYALQATADRSSFRTRPMP